MKLIHCADLHLDSRLNTHLGREQAKRRRDELMRRKTGWKPSSSPEIFSTGT